MTACGVRSPRGAGAARVSLHLAQHGDDAGEVLPRRLLGGVRIVVEDGVDDRDVLRSRLRRAPRRVGEPELVPRRLGVEPLEQLRRRGVLADLTQQAVEVLVQVRVADEVARFDGLLDLPAQRAEPAPPAPA